MFCFSLADYATTRSRISHYSAVDHPALCGVLGNEADGLGVLLFGRRFIDEK
jgi:hypothetical protein